jgi:hypothetical protein
MSGAEGRGGVGTRICHPLLEHDYCLFLPTLLPRLCWTTSLHLIDSSSEPRLPTDYRCGSTQCRLWQTLPIPPPINPSVFKRLTAGDPLVSTHTSIAGPSSCCSKARPPRGSFPCLAPIGRYFFSQKMASWTILAGRQRQCVDWRDARRWP